MKSKGADRQLSAALETFSANEIIVPSLDDYQLSGVIRGQARTLGYQVGMEDSLIGSIAHRLELPVVTGNTQNFEQMIKAGLQISIENWRLN